MPASVTTAARTKRATGLPSLWENAAACALKALDKGGPGCEEAA